MDVSSDSTPELVRAALAAPCNKKQPQQSAAEAAAQRTTQQGEQSGEWPTLLLASH